MSSSRNTLLSSSKSKRESTYESDEPTLTNELKLDEQSYGAPIEGDIKDEEDEKKKKESEYTMSYYAEQDDKLADNQRYYGTTYDDSDSEEGSKNINTGTTIKGDYEANVEDIESSSDSEEPEPVKEDPIVSVQPAPTAFKTNKPSTGVSRAGSVRLLINQFQNIIESSDVKTQPQQPNQTSKLTEPSEPMAEAKTVLPVPQPVPNVAGSSEKINLRGEFEVVLLQLMRAQDHDQQCLRRPNPLRSMIRAMFMMKMNRLGRMTTRPWTKTRTTMTKKALCPHPRRPTCNTLRGSSNAQLRDTSTIRTQRTTVTSVMTPRVKVNHHRRAKTRPNQTCQASARRTVT